MSYRAGTADIRSQTSSRFRYGGKRTTKPRRFPAKKTYRPARPLSSVVKNAILSNIETKQHMIQKNADPIYDTLTGTGWSLSDIREKFSTPGGQGSGQYVGGSGQGDITQYFSGLKVRAQYLHVSGTILGPEIVNTGDGLSPGTFCGKIWVILDKQASNAQYLVPFSSVLAYDNLFLQTNQIFSPYNMVGGARFTVLAERTFKVGTNFGNSQPFDIKVPLRNQEFNVYPISTGSVYTYDKNIRIYYAGFFDNAAYTTGTATIQFASRFAYKDA